MRAPLGGAKRVALMWRITDCRVTERDSRMTAIAPISIVSIAITWWPPDSRENGTGLKLNG
jgi:hypothetical protein